MSDDIPKGAFIPYVSIKYTPNTLAPEIYPVQFSGILEEILKFLNY